MWYWLSAVVSAGGVCLVVTVMVMVVVMATPPGMVESARISVSVNL